MKVILFVFLSLFSFNLISQNEIITDRPDQTESPISVDVGIIQIESGVLFERSELSTQFSVERYVYPTNLFRIGLLNKLELRIVNELVSYKTIDNLQPEEISKISGTENLQIGLKYQFSEKDSKTIVGAIVHAILPSGSRGIGSDLYGIFSRINISHYISENKNISTNFGYNNYELDFAKEGLVKYQKGNFTYTLVYGVSLSKKVGIFIEGYGDYVNFENWETNADAGITYLLKDNIQLDYSYGCGIDQKMNFHSIGISIRLPK